ncbi:uracil-DNA glycosylase family protein [Acinetobacter sp. VNH17]|uniref:Uracil-DNA glycosylase family protein n=1 Tax=Acinetobacter thutiue TaxID=2998078 RepID=A0ABT7WK77_9GAMM|nr:uracil-DNA glycosylase family protein [Acinetobacter thutiue]MCY6410991.1 uracil-DNA glycosylase family protein [Acinetobacter thutiue]MDN0013093.1 uracil-DNA glycosylase family protein [Acinetobacter thutiue]
MIDIETHPLTPFLPSNAKLLMLGSFPPPQNRWKMNFYYPNYQNDMWRIFGLIFFSDKNHFLDLPNKNFKESQIREFLSQIGIGIFDTAYQIKRLQGNASDKFLEIVTPTDLSALLEQMPMCHTIMTTGDKATDTLMQHFPDQPVKPMIGQSVEVGYDNRELSLYRLPSSSRAYPLALEKKADVYKQFFEQIGLV